tara:strand:+ start:184 stop:759 length:576 start_codon:yes stop_codon:yes gene_type:complete
MNKNSLKIIFVIFAMSLSLVFKSFAGDVNKLKSIKAMQDGKAIIFLRHAKAPKVEGNRDFNVKFEDCRTQRNLNEEGRVQSKKIGNFFKKNKIDFYKVLSSPFCRCVETAKLAKLNYEISNLAVTLKSTELEKRINEIKKYIEKNTMGGNIIFITHFNVANPITKRKLLSGEMVVMTHNLEFIGKILIPYW